MNISDQTGHFEAIVFSEGLRRFREILEPGNAVVLLLQAGVERRCAGAHRHRRTPRGGGRQAPEGHAHLPARRAPDRQRPGAPEGPGEGEVSLVLILDNGEREVEVKLPGKYQASPR